MRTRATPESWHSLEDLAQRFERTPSEIEALARRHHWPRVNQEHGALIGVDLDVVARTLDASAATVHGSVLPSADAP